MDYEAILVEALRLVRVDPDLPALEAIQRAAAGSSYEDRRRAVELFQQALVRPEVGRGHAFQESILERAIRAAHREKSLAQNGSAVPQRSSYAVKPAALVANVRKGQMTDNTNNTNNSEDTIASRGKRYTVGDTFETVATMGLKPTDAGRKATCGFQFSRKTGKDGTMDLPAGTSVRYVGAKAVYDGQANSKRMIFRVAKGSKALLDGNEITLDSDIDIAGVVNHVDADDPYNIAAKANEAKRAEKAALKAQANAAKTEAA